MPKHYRHLSADERDHLAVLRSEGVPLRAIARVLGRDPATISRELMRNVPPLHTGYYLPHKAQARAEARWRAAVRRRRLRDPWVRGYVTRQLRRGWSPELIAGRLTRLRPANKLAPVLEKHPRIKRYVRRLCVDPGGANRLSPAWKMPKHLVLGQPSRTQELSTGRGTPKRLGRLADSVQDFISLRHSGGHISRLIAS